MTHAETQDLLLDLAYGELDAERAAELASHLEGCAECRKEKAAIEEARRLVRPLRELEEPPAGFDDRILAAARAQAQLEHDGNVGQVIEVTGSVAPLGMEAARIDAHGRVRARRADRRKPRWLMRAALGGSVAAAAALALVVSTSLQSRRGAERAVADGSEEYKIRVEPAAPQAVDRALRDAEARKDQIEPPKPAAFPPPAAEALQKDKVAKLRAPKNPRQAADAQSQGSGGDAAGAAAPPAASADQFAETQVRQKEVSASRGTLAMQSPALAAADSAPAEKQAPAARSATPAPSAPPVANKSESAGVPVGGVVGGTVAPSVQFAPPARRKASNMAAAPAAGEVEASAQQARHAGDYPLAASLYRQAAALREGEQDPAAAAWNLAHAVECLSAAGQFDEARTVRDDLERAHPSETGALSAARRALREVEPATPAEKPR